MQQEPIRGATRPSPRRPRQPDGFTLVELMVVVAIAAVLVTMAVPSYVSTLARYRISTEANALVGDLQYARSEAVKQGFTVQVCISTDSANCNNGTTSWMAGRIVKTVPSDPAVAAAVLRIQRALPGTDTMTDTVNGTTVISFNREGFAGQINAWNSFTAMPQGVMITIHDVNNTVGIGSCVQVSTIGQISVLAKGTGGCA